MEALFSRFLVSQESLCSLISYWSAYALDQASLEYIYSSLLVWILMHLKIPTDEKLMDRGYQHSPPFNFSHAFTHPKAIFGKTIQITSFIQIIYVIKTFKHKSFYTQLTFN
jgi:hypothetical protein